MRLKDILTLAMLCAASTHILAQQSSVLSAGKWWQLTIDHTGIYKITTADIPEMRGVQIAHIGVYGKDGAMLSTNNSTVQTGDMPQIASDIEDNNNNGIFDDGDALLFYAEDVAVWRYNNTLHRWTYEHHAYSEHNYCYLTTSAEQSLRITTESVAPCENTVNTYTAVAVVDNDLVNIFESGQKWMGEKFSSAIPSRSYHMEIAPSAHGLIDLRLGLANKDYTTGSFTIATNGYEGSVGVDGTTIYATTLGQIHSTSSAFDIAITFAPGSNTASGYLDFIEMNSTTTMNFGGGQLIMRHSPTPEPVARYVLAGATGKVRVWEVSHTGQEREMLCTDGVWYDTCNIARQYIAFDGSSYLSPSAIAPVANQNLHGCPEADLVIVANPLFMEQAERIATLHEVMDGLQTMVVPDYAVYHEYSSGKQDPIAIRTLLRDMSARYADNPPRYLLLFGKGTYDNRNLLGNNLPTVVTYETPYSFDDDGASWCSDDMLGYTGANSIGSGTEELMVSVGRLPAKNTDEANHLVDKIEGYIMRRDLMNENEHGDWRNWVALLSDDADPGHPFDSTFVHSNEVVARNINQDYPQLNIDKLYADSYHQSTGAIGSYYPDLNNALQQRMNNGCLLINYIGHGSSTYIGTERYMELSDIEGYSNTDRLPLFVTSTCTFGRYDLIESLCGAEAAILAPAGAVAVMSAARPITHNERFNNDVVQFALDPHNTIGDALRKAKNRTNVPLCISLLGDPALRLSQPDYRVVVTHINNQPVTAESDDTATVLSRVVVRGEIQDAAGTLVSDFDGTLYPIVFDRTMRTATLANDNPGTEVSFSQQKNVLYRGSQSVAGGQFEYSFVVPKDVAYQYAYAKLSHYAKSASEHATGCYNRLLLGGMNDTANISNAAPEIALFIGDTNFRSGGITNASPTLIAHLFDSAGINAGYGLGHDITAILDDNPGSLVVLNDLYEPDVENFGRGSVRYQFADIATGHHTLTLKAWNIFNISAEATINFYVHRSDTLTTSPLTCYPNPARNSTRFLLEANNIESIASAELHIYNSQGQVVATFTPDISAGGYTVGPVVWNLQGVMPGLYLARMIVVDKKGNSIQQMTKCIVQ